MHVGVLGINHKLADLKLREKLAKICRQRFDAAGSLHYAHPFVLLSTCNRTEIYFSSDDLAKTHSYFLHILRSEIKSEFDHKLYSYFGIDCFSHLACVTTGLNSAVIAETEIQGQVKNAYELYSSYTTLPKELHALFQRALQTAKKVRSELHLGRGMPTIEHAIFNSGRQFFKNPEDIDILFVGASEINKKILSHFLAKKLPKITVCNRSLHNARTLFHNTPVQIIEWNRLQEWHSYDWIIFGTKSPDYLIHRHMPTESIGKKLIMDLSVPRNVDPALAQKPDITLLNIDQLNNLLKMRNQSMNESRRDAESMIYRAADRLASRHVQKESYQMNSIALPA